MTESRVVGTLVPNGQSEIKETRTIQEALVALNEASEARALGITLDITVERPMRRPV